MVESGRRLWEALDCQRNAVIPTSWSQPVKSTNTLALNAGLSITLDAKDTIEHNTARFTLTLDVVDGLDMTT